ncbi:amidohydrolase family protein [Amnibacterium flavum]|uniref:S-adenosylhomocysteine deaminase n=1 Tax=Amnibacterium flavum TaxID=2173173 RepID=A0A2V1HTI3_9MICO|nr:amidohydrolase family protein [Amnibacterium flavum]PVZ93404.1 S-adenosylhomocysteine deaminase [Amnibacterium flavum]
MTQLIVADHVWTGDPANPVLSPGAIEIEEGRVLSVSAVTGARPSGPEVTDLGASVVMPGLVNAHAHTPMSLMRGVAEGVSLLTMEGFLETLRANEEYLTPELVPASVAVSCADMIAHGTTAFADQYFFADEIVPTVQQSGLRARIAWGIVELGDDDARARELAATTAFVESTQSDELVRGWVGPHAFFVDNQPDAIRIEVDLAARLGIGLHAHFSTSSEEDDFCLAEYGRPALPVMREFGLLDLPLILAHCNTVPVDQLPILAGTRATMAVIPSVAMQSGAPAAPVREALDAGVNVALGSDNVCNNTGVDLFEEMRALGKLAAFTSKVPNQVTSREILEIATVRGHRALDGGVDDGRIVPGAVADLIAIPVAAIHRGPRGAQSLESALVYCTSGASVSHTMVAGRWLMADGVVQTIDAPAALARQQTDWDTLSGRRLVAEAVSI